MKLSRTYLFIIISSIALLTVLIIQVHWILQTAKMKEQLFNEKANIVLSKTADAISTDMGVFKSMQIPVGKSEVQKVDSLFRKYMKLYNIRIDYFFELTPTTYDMNNIIGWKAGFNSGQPGCYEACIGGDASDKGMLLKLVFPDEKQFIMAEMGTPFITSVILIIVVLVLSWRTIFSLLKEKKIAEHTTDFLNNMTHEFKTPLTNIALAGKMMVREANISQDEKVKHYSAIILDENEKLKQQVEQVLSMAALERDEIPIRKTELDFHQLIRDSLKRSNLQIENTQGSVKLKLEAKQFVIMGDKTNLANAFCNLIDNAIKYAKEMPELSICTFDNARQLIITVTDNGIGIEKEYQRKVFDKFFRIPTGNVHDVKGFGIGLAYVRKIIELHGGTIELKSEMGEGTTFTIKLPYA